MPIVSRQSAKTQTNRTTSRPAPTQISKSGSLLDSLENGWNLAEEYKVLLYGASGTGKTTFWATWPGPILTLICSGSSRPGELKSIDTPEYRKKIKPVVIPSVAAMRTLIAEAEGFKTVVLDHATGFADLVIKELLGLGDIPVAKSKIAGKGESWSLVSQQQYGQLAIIAKEMFRDLLNLPANVIIVAQERTFGDEAAVSEVIKPTVGAALTPSITGWLNPACDYVVQTCKRPRMTAVTRKVGNREVTTYERDKGVEYFLRTEPHDVYMTKFRVPLKPGRELPEGIVDPTYEKFVKIVKG